MIELNPLEVVEKFETEISKFFGSKFAVATDSCTHAIELSLRYTKHDNISCPRHTYLSVPMTFMKLNLSWSFNNQDWKDYYFIEETNIIDAAVLWKEHSYVPDTFMCLSFQLKKHLKLGRGGMILTDNKLASQTLKKMSYDGRLPNVAWAEQDVDMLGYHYYMTPEVAADGITKFNSVKNIAPKQWSYLNYPNLQKMKLFQRYE